MSTADDSVSVQVHMTIQKWSNPDDHAAGLPPDETDEYDYEETPCS